MRNLKKRLLAVACVAMLGGASLTAYAKVIPWPNGNCAKAAPVDYDPNVCRTTVDALCCG